MKAKKVFPRIHYGIYRHFATTPGPIWYIWASGAPIPVLREGAKSSFSNLDLYWSNAFKKLMLIYDFQ